MTDEIDTGPADQTDQTDQTEQAGQAAQPDQVRRRPSPSAAAASRARRIGGRPLPGPAPATDDAEPVAPQVDATERARRPGPEAAPRPAPRPRGQRLQRLGWLPALVAGVAAAAMLLVGVWQSHGVWWAETAQDATRNQTQQEVLAVAKTCAAAILSYDYRKLDEAEAAGKACTTGQLRSDYAKAMETTVKQLAPQSKTVQTLQVAKAAIESVSPDGKQWVVLVYGQQAVTNAQTKAGDPPRLDLSSPEVTLDRVGGKWLVSNLGNPG